ncbi:MAG: hemolysin family protein [Anaeromyxobacter sp.]
MEGLGPLEMFGSVAALAALVALRAVAAALEAALVALGVPRAQALGTAPDASRRARALAALMLDREVTAFTIRFTTAFSMLLLGLLAGTEAAWLVPRGGWWGGLVAAVGVGLLTLPISALARSLGAAHGEPVALALARPFRLLRKLLRPLARLVMACTFGQGRFSMPAPPLDEMERALAEYARADEGAAAGSATTTSELIHRVFEFKEKVARDLMVPRTDVVAVEGSTPVPEIIQLLAEEGHSRMPVYRESLDRIEGVLHARDLVPLLAHPELIVLRDLLRPAHFVPWSKPIDQLLREMQRRKLHMAFVVDEFGGVMGICTIEDVLEQIVGEIQDEFEEDEDRLVEAHADGTFTAQGAAPVAEFNRVTGAGLPEDQDFETVSGFVSSLAGAIPARGDRLHWKDWAFTVAEADPRKVTKVRAARVKRG